MSESTDNKPVKSAGSNTSLRRGAIAAAAGLGVLAVGYLGTAYAVRDKIPRGTSVAGVDVGGLTQPQVEQRLAKVQFPAKNQTAKLTVDGHTMTFKPGSAWKINASESAQNLSGFTLNPGAVANRLFGHEDKRPGVFSVDDDAIATTVESAAADQLPGSAKLGTVKFIQGKAYYTPGIPGATIDASKVAQQVAAGFPKKTAFTAQATELKQSPREEALAKFAKTDAQLAMSKPLTVSANGESLRVPATVVSDAISTKIVDDKPQIVVSNPKPLMDFVLSQSTTMRVAPEDAKVVWKQGKPSVAAAKDGEEIDTSKLKDIIPKALTSNHQANLPLRPAAPQVAVSDIDVSKLPSKSMAHFESALPTGSENAARTKNITHAVNRLNGQFIKPGQQFSLLRALGYDFSKENGYVEAGTIQNGLHVNGQGGGVSQVSTVVYNTAFFAGVQLDAHTPHAYYLKRYPIGREATIWNPGIDNKWTNNTSGPILIKASVKDDKVVMDFYGTKKYEVKTWEGEKQKVQQPKTREVKDVKGCENTKDKGTEGFEIDVFRQLIQGGKVVKTEKIHTKYKPDDIIKCVNTPAPDKDKPDTTETT